MLLRIISYQESDQLRYFAMANNSEDKPNAFAATLDDAKAAAEQGVTELKKQVDGVLTEAASHLVAGGVVAADTLKQGLDVAHKLADEGKASPLFSSTQLSWKSC